jgi:glycine/sarcosine N-methyltransferase
MEFYTSIAPWYGDIFPFGPGQKRLVDSFLLNGTRDSVLDVGCATGELAIYLAGRAKEVFAIDLDPDLIAVARSKIAGQKGGNVHFSLGDMMKVDGYFPAETFRYAFCLGNTLAHLPSPDEATAFLRRVSRVLALGGQFVFQILNYERILSHAIRELPLIDNDRVTFERRYGPREDGRLDFLTALTVKATGKVIKNSIPLYPLTMAELKGCAARAGLTPLRWVGDFGGNDYTGESDLLIGVLEK